MITKTMAVKKSIKRWENIIKALEQDDLLVFNDLTIADIATTSCAFCEFRSQAPPTDDLCGICPLSPDICLLKTGPEPDALYWRIVSSQTHNEQLKLSRQMLQEIKTRGEKWIKNESQS